ncbi:hypothetical protein RE6C_03268 [Rhodopirellula europaea 6C]|uniref:Uncharacterized protein n=1 Tax=Rhodopirellula europaea 6C TaxID=1263867 RepID=M2AFY9_9BACT|nr:hypothetical protein RE6C_03268 [Rhodopirellula europaea 6C]
MLRSPERHCNRGVLFTRSVPGFATLLALHPKSLDQSSFLQCHANLGEAG